MSAPLVAGAACARPGCGHGEDLHDGICFGTACECVRFVESADVLPVPAGPQPPRPIAYAAKNTDLLLADAAERSRAAEWPWDMWCRICHIRPTSHRTEAEALEAADRHVKLQHASQAEVHKLMAAGGLSELETLRARVGALEVELATANGVLEDVAKARRAGGIQALPWAHEMPDGDLHGFLDDLVSAALGRWRSGPEVPDRTVLADIERVCANWRTPGEGFRSDADEEAAPDAVPHDLPVSRDQPVPPTCGLDAGELDEISRDVWSGGGAQ